MFFDSSTTGAVDAKSSVSQLTQLRARYCWHAMMHWQFSQSRIKICTQPILSALAFNGAPASGIPPGKAGTGSAAGTPGDRGTQQDMCCTYAALRGPDKDAAVFAEVDLHLRREVANVDVAVFAIFNNKHLSINLSRLLDAYLQVCCIVKMDTLRTAHTQHQHMPRAICPRPVASALSVHSMLTPTGCLSTSFARRRPVGVARSARHTPTARAARSMLCTPRAATPAPHRGQEPRLPGAAALRLWTPRRRGGIAYLALEVREHKVLGVGLLLLPAELLLFLLLLLRRRGGGLFHGRRDLCAVGRRWRRGFDARLFGLGLLRGHTRTGGQGACERPAAHALPRTPRAPAL